MKNQQGIQLAFNLRHENGQQFMTFARIFIANDIDKIHTLSNESALLLPLLPLLTNATDYFFSWKSLMPGNPSTALAHFLLLPCCTSSMIAK